MSKKYSTIVIGGGLMGSSVAWQLASYGEDVLLLEQQGRKYNHGSSYGRARITRSLGKRKDIFSFLQQTTIAESQRLIDFLNGVGDPSRHTMEQVYTTSPVNYLYSSNQLLKVQKALHPRQKVKYEIGVGASAADLFGATLPDYQFMIREYKEYSGTFNPKVLTRMLHKGIKRRNGKVKYRRRVLSVTKVDDHYQVKIMHTGSGKTKRLKANKVVFASGPYNARLLTDLAPYYDQLVNNKRLPLTFLKIKRRIYDRLSQAQRQQILLSHPVFDQSTNKYFASIDQHGAMFFSMVEEFNKQGQPIFKVGGHQLRSQVYDLDAVWQERPTKKEEKWSREKLAKYLKLINVPIRKKDLKIVRASSCVYAMSSTRKPIVCNLLRYDGQPNSNLVVMGGMSGVGAKGCLAYGLIAANLLLGIDDSRPIYRKTRRQLSKASVIAAHYIRKHGHERMSKFSRYQKKKRRLI